jgi:hypothetical protein
MADEGDAPEQFGTPCGVLALVLVVVVVGPIFLAVSGMDWLAGRLKAVGRRVRGRR